MKNASCCDSQGACCKGSANNQPYPAYPSLAAASAPPLSSPFGAPQQAYPIAQPVDMSNHARAAMPPPQAYPASNHNQQFQATEPIYLPPAGVHRYKERGCLGTVISLAFFHLVNAIFGISAFVIVVTGTTLSFGLIPLCCFGIVIFRVLLLVVSYLAELDVKLYNYISPPDEHVFVSIPRDAGVFGLAGRRLSPSLSEFSPLALMATLYFATIKFGLSLLSVVSLALMLTWPMTLIVPNGPNVMVNGIRVHEFNFNTDPVGYTIAMVCFLIIGIAGMHLVAKLSRSATRFFCCEKFSTYRFIQSAQYPVAMAAYGSTGNYQTV